MRKAINSVGVWSYVYLAVAVYAIVAAELIFAGR